MARAIILVSAVLFITSCTQTDYSSLKPTPEVVDAQEKYKQQKADYKAKVEAQQKVYKDSVLENIKAVKKTDATENKSTVNAGNGVDGKKSIAKKIPAKSTKATSRIKLNAPWRCVPNKLKTVIVQVSRKFGPVIVNSTRRSRGRNRRIGGAGKSWHIGCRAVDFRVKGRTRGLYKWLRRHPNVGGLKRYRSGFYHIDIGPRRSW